MYRIQPVQDLDLPELLPYRTMRSHAAQQAQGIFVAEGEKVVHRLLESRLEVVSVLLPDHWAAAYADLLAGRPEDFTVYTAPKQVLETLTGFSMYQGLLAVARIPASIPLEAAIARAPKPKLFVAVENVSSAQNLGGLMRNCVAFGAQTLIVGESCCSPYLRRAVRSSMGTVFKLPIVEPECLLKSIPFVQASGLRVIAAHPHTDRKWLPQAQFAEDCMLVFGSEGQGISPPILAACDESVAIPMQNDVDSLNVGAAGAVFLYEVFRQRQLC